VPADLESARGEARARRVVEYVGASGIGVLATRDGAIWLASGEHPLLRSAVEKVITAWYELPVAMLPIAVATSSARVAESLATGPACVAACVSGVHVLGAPVGLHSMLIVMLPAGMPTSEVRARLGRGAALLDRFWSDSPKAAPSDGGSAPAQVGVFEPRTIGRDGGETHAFAPETSMNLGFRIAMSLLLSVSACGGRLGTSSAQNAQTAADGGSSTSQPPPADAAPPAPADPCQGVCGAPLPALSAFSNAEDALAALQGSWTICSATGSTGLPGSTKLRVAGTDYVLSGNGGDTHGSLDIGLGLAGPLIYLTNVQFSLEYNACPTTFRLTSVHDASGQIVLIRDGGGVPPPQGACPVVGTFDSTSHWDGKLASFQFSADGTFVGGALGAKLPAEATFSGKYSASAAQFTLIESTGMVCGAMAQFPLVWTPACDKVRFMTNTDNCTGGRAYLGGGSETDMTRR
jgi:hypothetical protein